MAGAVLRGVVLSPPSRLWGWEHPFPWAYAHGYMWTLQEHGIAAVPHGFRSTFRDWAGEETDHPREVIEAALAHVVQNRVEAAYARSDLFERRRTLMDEWARYLAQGTGEDSEP